MFERILVEEIAAPDRTPGGLMIPVEAKEIPVEGVVISVGHLVNKEDTLILPGDRVLYLKYSGLPVSVGDKQYKMIMANDVLAVWEEPAPPEMCCTSKPNEQ